MNLVVPGHMQARLAQSVEHGTLNPGVVGSSPTLGGKFFFCLSWGLPGLLTTRGGIPSEGTSRNSSVGRALDWRSKGPWFNPGFRQQKFLSKNFFGPHLWFFWTAIMIGLERKKPDQFDETFSLAKMKGKNPSYVTDYHRRGISSNGRALA